jgi:hypothetical protein
MGVNFQCNLRDEAMGGVVRAHMLKTFSAMLLAVALVSFSADSASAQVREGDRIDGHVAGTVGLGLLGAEVGLLLTPAFNLQDHWWAWVLFPAIGAAGGAVAGVFALEDVEPAVTVSILGAGMLLAVPAVVSASAIASARRGAEIDEASNPGLLRFGKRGTRVGVPTVSTAPVFSATEQARFGLPQRTSTRVSLISGRF